MIVSVNLHADNSSINKIQNYGDLKGLKIGLIKFKLLSILINM